MLYPIELLAQRFKAKYIIIFREICQLSEISNFWKNAVF
jgi:hypothetical protein